MRLNQAHVELNMLLKWISGLFVQEQSPARAAGPVAAPPAAAAATPAAPGPGPGADSALADTSFYRWLAEADPHQPPLGTDTLMLEELDRLARSPGAGAHLVPRVPAIVPKLLRGLRDENMSGADLSRILSQDVVLVAEVIRAANSPLYRPAQPITTIEAAVMLLGQNGMRMVVARVAFRPVISSQAGKLARHAAPHVWRHAEKCAMAASLLAPRMGAHAFEAYLAGLMHNVGLIVALRLFDQLYPEAMLPKSEAFYAALASRVRTLSAHIAASWDFPDTVSAAIGVSGQPGAPALARTVALADRLASLRILADAGRVNPADPAVLAGLDEGMLACFEKLSIEEE